MEATFSAFQRHAWVLGLTLSLAYGLATEGQHVSVDASMRSFNDETTFVRSSTGECDALWGSWPEVQERAIADGTVMIWNMTTSVGNLMRTLMYILPVSSDDASDVLIPRSCRHVYLNTITSGDSSLFLVASVLVVNIASGCASVRQ